MKIKLFVKLFGSVLFLIVLFCCNQVLAVPAPHIANVYFFTQIKSISPTENEATIYRKQACFQMDLEYCRTDDQSKDTVNVGSGYHHDRFSTLNPYLAIPVLNFKYNPEKWTLEEDNEENQILVSKTDKNKIIFLIGRDEYKYLSDKKNKNTITLEKSYVIENSEIEIGIEPAKIENIYRKQLGDFLYIFFDNDTVTGNYKEVKDKEFLYSTSPHTFVLLGDSLSESDKEDFFVILKSVKFGKQYVGELFSEAGYNFNEAIFFNENEFRDWWSLHATNKNGLCYSALPDYLKIRKNENCYSLAVDSTPGVEKKNCFNFVSLTDPNMIVGQSSMTQTEDDFFNSKEYYSEDCYSLPNLLYDHFYSKNIIDIEDERLQTINEDFSELLSECNQKTLDIKSISDSKIQVFSSYDSLNVSNVEDELSSTQYKYFSLDELDEKKFDKVNFSYNNDNVLYPLMRIYAYKINDSGIYLKKNSTCLSFSSKNNWVYLGYSGEYAILVEFIPDKNEITNFYLSKTFFYKLKYISFYDTDYTPFKDFVSRFHEKKERYHLSVVSNNPKVKIDWFDKITTFNSEYTYISFEDVPSYGIDKVNFYLSSDFDDFMANQYDEPFSKGKDIFFVGQNEDCEKDDFICVDIGSSWDYMDNGDYDKIIYNNINKIIYSNRDLLFLILSLGGWFILFILIFFLLIGRKFTVSRKYIVILALADVVFNLVIFNVFDILLFINPYEGYLSASAGLLELLFVLFILKKYTSWKRILITFVLASSIKYLFFIVLSLVFMIFF